MTLVLAIRCRDGIVLASDGQATTDAAGQPTRQSVRKLFTVGRRIAWGAAGSLGLVQALQAELSANERLLLEAPDPRALLVEIVVSIQHGALDDFVMLPGAEPPDLSCVFCWWDGLSGRATILSIPRTGSGHQLHDDYAALGTGDIFAAFAMESLSHLRFAELEVAQARLMAYKVVSDAIEVAAVFLGPPVQMTVVTAAEGALELSQGQIEGELSAGLAAWEARQRATFGAPVPSLMATLRAVRGSA
jgi:proteasome beta subunit